MVTVGVAISFSVDGNAAVLAFRCCCCDANSAAYDDDDDGDGDDEDDDAEAQDVVDTVVDGFWADLCFVTFRAAWQPGGFT